MYKTRSDALLQIPYGDSLFFGGEIDYIIPSNVVHLIEPENNEIQILGQVRNQQGRLLATLNPITIDVVNLGNDKRKLQFYVHTDELIPVGLHYMDIRVEFTSKIPNIMTVPLVSHSEVIQLEILKSVSHPFHIDISGQDKGRLEQYE